MFLNDWTNRRLGQTEGSERKSERSGNPQIQIPASSLNEGGTTSVSSATVVGEWTASQTDKNVCFTGAVRVV